MRIPFDNTYAQLPAPFFAATKPTPVTAPKLIQINHTLAGDLGIDSDWLSSPEGIATLSGNEIADGSQPIAMAYSGHQFGGFSPQLGDGRAILLGEVVSQNGIRHDIHLKGSGPTPFSRRGDGRSALGPVLREYIVSEAMAALGVPTTRALAAVTTGENVFREGPVPGGVFARVAQSHIRIGTFQWFAAQNDIQNLKVLADYTIDRHYPDLADTDQPYIGLLTRVTQRQAELIAHWMSLGFIHGVMNTDNMTVSGETIDYGPCAFMDEYHPAKTFSSIDHGGRYAFANQTPIGQWNLTRFAETLLPIIKDDPKEAIPDVEAVLDQYPDLHQAALLRRFTAKLGISTPELPDWTFAESLLEAMADGGADFTLTFRHLVDALESSDDQTLVSLFKTPNSITEWLTSWRSRLKQEDPQKSIDLMRASNPVIIPRNHRVEEAIQAGNLGDFTVFHKLNKALQNPFDANSDTEKFEAPPTPDEVVHATFCGT